MPKANATAEPFVDITPVESPITAEPVKVAVTPETHRTESDNIVMKATYASLGIGFIPVPIVDIIAVSGFQMKMIAELSELHNVKFSEHTARNIITSLVGSLGPVIIGQMAARTLLKMVPGVGTAIASLWVQGLIDGAATYGIGRVFQEHFEKGGTILDMDMKKAKEYFLIKFKEGKTVVAKSVGNATSAAASTFRSKDKQEIVTVAPTVPA